MKSLEELKAIRERMQGQIGMRSEHAKDTRVVSAWQPAALPAVRVRF